MLALRFPILLASQLTNMAPLVAYLLVSTTLAFADFVFIMFLGQLLVPILLLRLDIQVQVELARSRQRYYYALAFWILTAATMLCLLGAVLLGFGGSDRAVPGILFGAAVSFQGLVRAYAVARNRGLEAFEASNIIKNALAVGLAFIVPDTALAALFVGVNLAHGIGSAVYVGWIVGAPPRPRLLARVRLRGSLALRRAHKVIRYSLPNSFIGMATARLPILAIELALPTGIASGFVSASRLALSPLSFVIAALRILGVIELNKRRRDEPNRFGLMVAVIFGGAPIVMAPLLFPGLLKGLVAGLDPSWTAALDYLPMLYPWAMLFLAAGWLDRIFDTLGTQRRILWIEIFMFCLMALVSFGIWTGGAGAPMAALWAVAIASTLHSFLWIATFVYGERYDR